MVYCSAQEEQIDVTRKNFHIKYIFQFRIFPGQAMLEGEKNEKDPIDVKFYKNSKLDI